MLAVRKMTSTEYKERIRFFNRAQPNMHPMALTARQIIEIHDTILKKYGGTGGVLNEGTLELLVFKTNREKDIFQAGCTDSSYNSGAASFFFDGNKRTALAAAENTLGEAGYYLHADDEEIVHLMQRIAEYKCTVKTIEKWVREKAKATSLPVS